MFGFRVFAALLLLAAASPTLASDGVIELNEARALAGAITPGDTAGFPITLSLSGSYRLTANLNVPDDTIAIQITAPHVSLDLGGFRIAGGNVCSAAPAVFICTTTNGSPGISAAATGADFATVRNGSVTGMGGAGIHLAGRYSTVEDVRVATNGYIGIQLGSESAVRRSYAVENFASGISLETGGVAEANEVRGNGAFGIQAIAQLLGGSVIGNRAYQNGANGISISIAVPTNVLVSKNVAANNANNALPQISNGVSLNDNLCNGATC